jgi:phosphoribosylglycinamide formyltransferase-1
MQKKAVAFLISGSGSNLQALIDACAAPDFPARIALVLSNNADAYGLTRAQQAGITTCVLSHKDFTSREAFDEAIDAQLRKHGIELVCLAGFMRLLTPEFVTKWENALVNIHPSLLPSFKGTHVHEQVVAAGVRFSGCTVHFVRAQMDVGPIIAQAVVPVAPEDSAEIVAKRVLEQEHILYPQALRLLAEGKLSISNEKVFVQT